MQDSIVIVGAARTPMGAFQGELSGLNASDLGAAAIKSALQRAALSPEHVQDVLFGNCLMAGQGQAPARQAAIKAGIPVSAGAVTLSKMCGSAMQATMFGVDSILAGTNEVVVAGGMESMSNAPYLIPKARGGYRIGHGTLYDHMMLDGLEDAYDKGRSMGSFAEDCAAKYHFSRAAQGASRQDCPTQGCLQKGWDHHGGIVIFDQRWCCCAGTDAYFYCSASGVSGDCTDRGACTAFAGTELVHHGTHRRYQQAVSKDWLADCRY
jgi:hypothetical protein